MAKLVMLSGLPASGKSTRAKEIVYSGNWIRVNRDLLRTMLHFDKWSGKNEDSTVAAEMNIASAFLLSGKFNVVVDDCNLNPKNKEMWQRIAKENNASFACEIIPTDYKTCILRDVVRDKSVGESVIMQMALQYGLYPIPEKGIVLCDLDGTLCDITHRLSYVHQDKKDWKGFFREIPNDVLRKEVLEIVEKYRYAGHEIFLVSARPEDYRKVTEEWLFKNKISYNVLIMRPNGDSREDTLVKAQMHEKYFKNFKIEAIIDDRPSVIRMWREKGLNVIDVGAGLEF